MRIDQTRPDQVKPNQSDQNTQQQEREQQQQEQRASRSPHAEQRRADVVKGLHLPLGRRAAGLGGPGRTGEALGVDAGDGGRTTGALAGAVGADGAQGGLAAVATALLGTNGSQHRQGCSKQHQGQHQAGGGRQTSATGEQQR